MIYKVLHVSHCGGRSHLICWPWLSYVKFAQCVGVEKKSRAGSLRVKFSHHYAVLFRVPTWVGSSFYLYSNHVYIYRLFTNIHLHHFDTYLDYMPISSRCYFWKEPLKANGLVYHDNVKAKNNNILVTCDLKWAK